MLKTNLVVWVIDFQTAGLKSWIIAKMEDEGHQKNQMCAVPTKKVKCIDDLKKWEGSEAYQVTYAGCTTITIYLDTYN